ncbi:hypothetical protein [uncultured Chitinophaga sp.]|uniref:hypothetical protein n=1 Tax=uncultured Chitinophaga sp. TaxID=339340 RepID=UPI0025D11630|nr:hypothetical protein [uncultured Chitinophaga sp.]
MNASDSYMAGRLTRQFVKVIQADATSTRGQRNVIDGETELLQGFEFNINGRLPGTLYAPFTATINRVTGALTVDVPPFVPINMIAAPAGATHCKLTAAAAEIDFEAETFINDTTGSGDIVLGPEVTVGNNLELTLTANSTKPLFLAFGIEFYQEVNGSMYLLKSGAFNAMQLVKISSGV